MGHVTRPVCLCALQAVAGLEWQRQDGAHAAALALSMAEDVRSEAELAAQPVGPFAAIVAGWRDHSFQYPVPRSTPQYRHHCFGLITHEGARPHAVPG